MGSVEGYSVLYNSDVLYCRYICIAIDAIGIRTIPLDMVDWETIRKEWEWWGGEGYLWLILKLRISYERSIIPITPPANKKISAERMVWEKLLCERNIGIGGMSDMNKQEL